MRSSDVLHGRADVVDGVQQRSRRRILTRERTHLLRELRVGHEPCLVAELRERLRVRSTAACAGFERQRASCGVESRAVVEIQYNELVQGRLRHAVLRGVRT